MAKKAFQRGLLGFPLWVFLGYVVTIGISLARVEGDYFPCVPELIEQFGSEINAVIFQAVMCGIMGTAFAAASVIWEKENWGIVKQTGIYFLVSAIILLPVAYFTHWMERSLSGFLLYFALFTAIFVLLWIVQYCIWKRKIQAINKKIKEGK
jgi:hypothetical protein